MQVGGDGAQGNWGGGRGGGAQGNWDGSGLLIGAGGEPICATAGADVLLTAAPCAPGLMPSLSTAAVQGLTPLHHYH